MQKNDKIMLITPEFGKDKGGIQNWMYFTVKLLRYHFENVNLYAYREERSFAKFFYAARADNYFLATWKMSLLIAPFAFVGKKNIFIFVLGNEILNLNYLQRKYLQLLTRRPNAYFISVSKASAEIFFDKTGRKIDIVQYPFMEIPGSAPGKSEAKCPKFFTVSRLVKRKNIKQVIEALYELKQEGFKYHYIIAGTGSEEKNLSQMIEDLSLGEQIRLVGKISEKQKEDYFRESDYFLLPSLFDAADGSIEGYGIVFIEANSYGAPVLGGNTGGMVEAVVDGQTGYHCDGTVEDIKDKIMKLIHTDFDSKVIFDHASKHGYLNQKKFVTFIKEKIYG